MQSEGIAGRGFPVRSKPTVTQVVTVQPVDIDKGVYLSESGAELGPIPKELLKKCREARGKNDS